MVLSSSHLIPNKSSLENITMNLISRIPDTKDSKIANLFEVVVLCSHVLPASWLAFHGPQLGARLENQLLAVYF